MTTALLISPEASLKADARDKDCEYDVFVNYHESDEKWVYDHLKLRLNQAEIRFSDKNDFRLGVPKLDEMGRCIAESRWTLLVLTRAYLASNWDDYFSLMCQARGLDEKKWRTIVLTVESGLKLPPSLEVLCGIDLSRDLEDEMEWARLIRGVGGEVSDQEPIAQGPLRQGGAFALRKGLDALLDLLASPEILRTVAEFQHDFRTCCEQIDILGDYKALHDQLHVLQFQCFNNVAFAALGFPDGPGTYEMLGDARLMLEQIVGQSTTIAARGKVAPQSWVNKLAAVQQMLSKAHDDLDPAPLATIISQLVRILAIDPSKINDRLNQTASILRLPQLGQALQAIRNVMNGPELDPEKVGLFDSGIKALTQLGVGLAAAIGEHNRWQEFDTELRLLENALKEDEDYDASWDWANLGGTMGPLYAGPEDWAGKLRSDAAALTQALEAKNGKRIRHKFRDFRAKAGIRFYEIDRDLLRHCEDLRMVGQPLCTLMEFTECAP